MRQQIPNNSDILPIFLANKWYDLIADRKKKVEYRRICDHWTSRLFINGTNRLKYRYVRFHRAYTQTMQYARIRKVDVGPCPYDGWEGDFYRIHFTLLDGEPKS